MGYQKKYKKFVATAATATLVASAIVPVASAKSFSDVAENNEFQPFIDALSDAGIINGYQDGTFKPGNKLTRGQVVKMLGRWVEANGQEIPADWNSKQRFNDVPTNSADEELVKYAALVKDAGVFTGSNGNLMAGNNITRQQMAKVLNGAYTAINGFSLVDLADSIDNKLVTDLASAQQEFEGYIQALVDLEISTVSVFRPTENVTRAQFAKFLYNTINLEVVEAEAVGVKAINNTTVEVTFEGEIDNIKDIDFAIEGLKVENAVVKQTAKNVAVLTTSAQEADKEYTVTVDGEKVGTFKGIGAVIPTKITTTTTSLQGVIGEQVTVKAQVAVAEGQAKENIPVTFNIVNNERTNDKIEVEVLTNAEGVATYSYTRYYGSEDTVTAYATKKSSIYDTAKVYWANTKQLTVKDITEATTLVNGAKKTYQIESAKNAGKYVFVTFEENLAKTPDKLTSGIQVEGVTTYTVNANGTVGTASTTKYPFEATTGGKAVTAVKLDSNGKANLVLTGANASVTPIVFEGELGNVTSGTVIGDDLSEFKSVVYKATALQAKASTVKFELKHTLGLTIEAQGSDRAALNNNYGTGGRDYVITYTDKDGKPAGENSTVLVAIPKAGVKGTLTVLDVKGTTINPTSSDTDNYYYSVKVAKEGKATFTVTSTQENDYVEPVAFINNGTSKDLKLDTSDLQTKGTITYFVKEVKYEAKLGVFESTATDAKEKTSFVSGKDSAYSRYTLVDQNGKVRKADANTKVSFEVLAGESPLTVTADGKVTTIPAGKYTTVEATIAQGTAVADIKVDAAAPTSVTITASGSKAGIVLPSTTPASVSAKFTRFATQAVVGTVVTSTLDTTNNTVALVDTKGNVHVYNYTGQTLLNGTSAVAETVFEDLLIQGTQVTVTKDDAGKLTFSITRPGDKVTILNAQQTVDYTIQKAVVDGKTSVAVDAKGAGNIAVNTVADIDITVNVDTIANLTINTPNTDVVNIVKTTGNGQINGDLNVTAPKAHVTVGTDVTVAGTTNIYDVSGTSFVNNGNLGAVNIYDGDASKFVNNKTVGSVIISGEGKIEIGGTSSVNVIVASKANVTVLPSTKGTLTVTNLDANVTNNSTQVEVTNITAIQPVTSITFKDTNKGVNIVGEIEFDVTKSLESKAVTFDIALNGTTVATKVKADAVGETNTKIQKIKHTFKNSLSVGDVITVVAKDDNGKSSSVTEHKIIDAENDQTDVVTEAQADVNAKAEALKLTYENNVDSQGKFVTPVVEAGYTVATVNIEGQTDVTKYTFENTSYEQAKTVDVVLTVSKDGVTSKEVTKTITIPIKAADLAKNVKWHKNTPSFNNIKGGNGFEFVDGVATLTASYEQLVSDKGGAPVEAKWAGLHIGVPATAATAATVDLTVEGTNPRTSNGLKVEDNKGDFGKGFFYFFPAGIQDVAAKPGVATSEGVNNVNKLTLTWKDDAGKIIVVETLTVKYVNAAK